MSHSSKTFTFVFDPHLMLPGCVLLQAIGGCGGAPFYRFFGDKEWLVAPTPGMRRLTGTTEEWERVVKKVKGR